VLDKDVAPECDPVRLPNQSGLQNYCSMHVRHGLNSPVTFAASTKPVRHLFLRYAHAIAIELSQTKPFQVYFPLPLKQFGIGNISRIWANASDPPAGTSAASWQEQQQLVRYCPDGPNSPPRKPVFYAYYRARDCAQDVETISEILSNPNP
jgi:hypothetical protein